MSEPSRRKPRVAVVEDEELLRSSLSRWLAMEFEVGTFETAMAFLEAVRGGQTFEVVLFDQSMPGMKGEALVAELARSHPELVGGCVLMTGRSLDELNPDVLDLIEDRVVQKPFAMNGLAAYLRELVAERTSSTD